MDWSVVFPREADQDFGDLGRGGADKAKLEAAVVDQFKGFKGDRLRKLLEAGTSTGAVDRLEASVYPTAIRLQVLQDFRATAWLFPAQRHAFVVSVFAKARDPDYRKAVVIHDSRLRAYMDSLQAFHDRRKHR